jgi:anti-anti-sigma factor
MVERPALAGQAPQLNNATLQLRTRRRPKTRTLPNRRVLLRMGAYSMDRHTIEGMVDFLPGMPGDVYADKQLVVSLTTSPTGLSFAGEIDASNSHAVSTAIASAQVPDKDIHVDVEGLVFCDISGIRAFVTAAESLPEGRRLLLHGMPAMLETVIKVVGWNRIPALVVCECGSD